jgi:hypothetical protein
MYALYSPWPAFALHESALRLRVRGSSVSRPALVSLARPQGRPLLDILGVYC